MKFTKAVRTAIKFAEDVILNPSNKDWPTPVWIGFDWFSKIHIGETVEVERHKQYAVLEKKLTFFHEGTVVLRITLKDDLASPSEERRRQSGGQWGVETFEYAYRCHNGRASQWRQSGLHPQMYWF